ncbi:MAG: YfiR family protein [Mariprofundaceae bacterium]|nr:YfiR family protein [Mariprofundaceae bacterium]
MQGIRIKHELISLLICFFLLPSGLFASESLPIVQEDKIKAVYIFNFVRFTEWPLTQTTSANKRMNLSILGNRDLLKILNGKSFRKTALGVRLNARVCVMPSCITDSQALFIDSSESEVLTEMLSLLSNKPVLTISDIPGFAEQGGMIELNRDNDKIIFRINLEAIKRVNLYVSSQLLQMAEIVGNKP